MHPSLWWRHLYIHCVLYIGFLSLHLIYVIFITKYIAGGIRSNMNWLHDDGLPRPAPFLIAGFARAQVDDIEMYGDV